MLLMLDVIFWVLLVLIPFSLRTPWDLNRFDDVGFLELILVLDFYSLYSLRCFYIFANKWSARNEISKTAHRNRVRQLF